MEGDSSSPLFEWVISRVCEEFHCLPSQAVKEIMTDPNQMALEIMQLRNYARAKEALDNAKNADEIPDSPAIDQVWMVQAEIVRKEGK